MAKLQNVIQTLFHLETQIKFQVETLNLIFDNDEILNEIKHKDFFANQISFRDSLNTIISNYTILPFCSFLEEYNKYFTSSYVEEEFKERVIMVKKQNISGIKRINEWKDLVVFRNELVAHNFRKKQNRSFLKISKIITTKFQTPIQKKNYFMESYILSA